MENIKKRISEGMHCRDCKYFNSVNDDSWNVDNIHYYCELANSCIDGFYHSKNDYCVEFTQKEKHYE